MACQNVASSPHVFKSDVGHRTEEWLALREYEETLFEARQRFHWFPQMNLTQFIGGKTDWL